MTPHRVKTIIDAYGADAGRWPEDEREAALALIARDSSLAADLAQAADLDALLATAPAPSMPRSLAETIFADALAARPVSGAGASQPPSFGGAVRAVAGRFWPGQPLLQPAIGLAASLAIGVWVGSLNIVPVTDITALTETASIVTTDDDGLSALYGDGTNLQEWVYDG